MDIRKSIEYTAILLTAAACCPILFVGNSSHQIGGLLFGCLLIAFFFKVELAVLDVLANKRAGRFLSSYDYSKEGIPQDSVVAILVSCMLSSKGNIDDIIELAERNFVISNDSSVIVVIAADPLDAAQASLNSEELAALDYLRIKLSNLNAKYKNWSSLACFYGVTRKRVYSTTETKWICRERKRGKIEEFVRLARGLPNALISISPEPFDFQCVKYVLSIDEDTALTRSCVVNLASALDHPNNSPEIIDGSDGPLLKSGYAAIVPIVLGSSSKLSNLTSGLLMHASRLDPDNALEFAYRSPSFDVYGFQPNTGKIFFCVHAYFRLCVDRIPQDIILSHDTVEGAYLHPGLISDAVVTEPQPASLVLRFIRSERWMRGDLQNFVVYIVARCVFGRRLPKMGIHCITRQFLEWLRPIALFAFFATLILFPSNLSNYLVLQYFLFYQVLELIPVVCRKEPGRFGRIWFAVGRGLRGSLIDLCTLPLALAASCSASAKVVVSLLTKKGLLQWTAFSLENRRSITLYHAFSIIFLLFSAVIFFFAKPFHSLPGSIILVLLTWSCLPVLIAVTKDRVK